MNSVSGNVSGLHVCIVIASIFKPQDPKAILFATNVHAVGDRNSVELLTASVSDDQIAADAEAKMGVKVTEIRRLILALGCSLGEVAARLALAIRSLALDAHDCVVAEAAIGSLDIYVKAIREIAQGKHKNSVMMTDSELAKIASAAKAGFN